MAELIGHSADPEIINVNKSSAFSKARTNLIYPTNEDMGRALQQLIPKMQNL